METLPDMIQDEIRDAEKYARCALEYKEKDPEMAQMFYDLSLEEKEHMEKLFKMEKEKIEHMQAMFNG